MHGLGGARLQFGANPKRENARVAAAMWGGADALLARPDKRRWLIANSGICSSRKQRPRR